MLSVMSSTATPAQPSSPRLLFALLALLAESAHLGAELLQGGILSHHLLARADLPALSNAWGLLLLPALAAWAAGGWADAGSRRRWLAGLALPLLLGVLLSIGFSLGQSALTESVFMLMLLLALLLPAHRPECLLGFVLGMSWTFGAVLPLLVGGLIALLSWLLRALLSALGRRGRRLLMPR